MRLYEAVIVLDPNMDTDLLIEKIREKIVQHGAKNTTIDRWGKKRFAYEIARKQYGDYSGIMFDGEPRSIAEIEHELRITEEVIRFLVYRVTKAQLKQKELDKVVKDDK